MNIQLHGKVAIVTAAAQGIGEASARLMADQGATVVLADINEEKVMLAAERIRQAGGQATGMRFDARDRASVRELVTKARKDLGRLDILHNNAGGTNPVDDRQVLDVTDETWEMVFAWNVGSTHGATRAAIPHMLEVGGGVIINTITAGTERASSSMTAYAAAKGAVATYTRYVAVEYGRRGIRCNGISPGLILTPHLMEAVPEQYQKNMFKQIPSRRLGKPEDIGHLAAFLASDAAAYINGQIITVCGGQSIRTGHDADTVAMGAFGPGHPAPEGLPALPWE